MRVRGQGELHNESNTEEFSSTVNCQLLSFWNDYSHYLTINSFNTSTDITNHIFTKIGTMVGGLITIFSGALCEWFLPFANTVWPHSPPSQCEDNNVYWTASHDDPAVPMIKGSLFFIFSVCMFFVWL